MRLPVPGLSGRLVFQSDRSGRPGIYRLDLETNVTTPLMDSPAFRDEEPTWSPDGTRIACGSTRGGNGDLDIWIVRADGRNPVRVTSHPAREEDPDWLPDGLSLVFAGECDGRAELYRVWLADKRVERLTRGLSRCLMPAVSPDGRRVAFAAQVLLDFQIHLLDLATGSTRQVTSGRGACRPTWSPDGRNLAFVRMGDDRSRIEVIPIETGAIRLLFSHPALWAYYPGWTNDQEWLFFSVSPEHHDGEDWDLAVMPFNRPGTWFRLTQGPGNDRAPDWTASSLRR